MEKRRLGKVRRKRRTGIKTHSVEEEKGGEVGSLLRVEHVHELGTVNGVSCSEPASREDAQLQELCDSSVLCHLCGGSNQVM